MRIGYGYDVHAFSEDRKLILGGLEVPYIKGLKGHSDADVLLHAITDALLGSLALGDIGKHFPDTDPDYEGADSRILLKESYKIVRDRGYELGNLDATIVAEKPKLQQYLPEMQNIIAGDLGVPVTAVSLKATTSERMGFVGRGEGIAVMATVLVKEKVNG
ncbi:2-C-methyl-D-erythritol 2,4-cyclodiphosphate synthase [Balneola sp. MJW-20]|uniref:2-C-methyl-D-erythritol 2,4-cyclodiphosphate synthase n=1 Tax=Gracilimonas aurantiaca TaxID=3234185 RepID=UPI0034660BFA